MLVSQWRSFEKLFIVIHLGYMLHVAEGFSLWMVQHNQMLFQSMDISKAHKLFHKISVKCHM